MSNSVTCGLVSVTFRSLSRERVVELVCEAGLAAIEWGGDIHVPHGDLAAAKSTRQLCADAGLRVSAYGSYYRLGPPQGADFAAVLETAQALGAPSIRVWAGNKGSAAASEADRRAVEDDLNRVDELAAAHGVRIDLEYHGGTLTDAADSTVALLARVPSPNVVSNWQPRVADTAEQSLAHLAQLRPRLGNLHVFHWGADPSARYPLADGADRWRQYLAAALDGRPRTALLEFVRGDDPEQFLRDAATLLALSKLQDEDHPRD